MDLKNNAGCLTGRIYIYIFTDIMDLKNDGGYLTGRVDRITTSSLLMLS